MKVAIVTEGGAELGFGHLTRCQSLAQAFSERGVECSWHVAGSPGDFLGQPFEPWTVLPRPSERVVIVDSLQAPPADLYALAREVELPVFLDDWRFLDFPRGLVIDWTVGAERAGREGLMGVRYTALRQPFWQPEPRRTRPQARQVLLLLGGSDVRGLLPRLAAVLPFERVVGVVGPGFARNEPLPGVELRRGLKAQEMRDAMLEADLAVSAGGQTLYELASVGTPVVSVSVVENARLDEQGWAEAGFSLHAGSWDDPDLETRVRSALERLEGEREARALIGQSLVDGQGARRIVDEVLARC